MQEIEIKLQRYRELRQERKHLLEMVPRLKKKLGSGTEAMKLYAKYEEIIQRIEKECGEVESLIARLEPTEQKIAMLHYLDGQSWENVSIEVGYSLRHIHRINNKIIAELEELEK